MEMKKKKSLAFLTFENRRSLSPVRRNPSCISASLNLAAYIQSISTIFNVFVEAVNVFVEHFRAVYLNVFVEALNVFVERAWSVRDGHSEHSSPYCRFYSLKAVSMIPPKRRPVAYANTAFCAASITTVLTESGDDACGAGMTNAMHAIIAYMNILRQHSCFCAPTTLDTAKVRLQIVLASIVRTFRLENARMSPVVPRKDPMSIPMMSRGHKRQGNASSVRYFSSMTWYQRRGHRMIAMVHVAMTDILARTRELSLLWLRCVCTST